MLTIECKFFLMDKWLSCHKQYHRANNPALYSFYSKGRIGSRQYLLHGLLHRNSEHGPAQEFWGVNGQRSALYYIEHGKLFRKDGPPILEWNQYGVLINQEFHTGI